LITLDPVLMELADIMEHEQVRARHRQQRFETYAITGGRVVVLNGAAALVHEGDRVIVIGMPSTTGLTARYAPTNRPRRRAESTDEPGETAPR
jgi:aspartate 1-decarboxylase